MAEELLRAKQDFKELSKNWSEKFLSRHLVLQSKYSRTLDQERFLTQNQDSLQEWFDLYLSIKAQHGILDKNTYNMDDVGPLPVPKLPVKVRRYIPSYSVAAQSWT